MGKLNVTILDMQPIDPPVGGGRLRLLGLYGGFKNNISATYIGTYDWRGPTYRDHMLSECLREIDVPLSEEHFTAHDELAALLGHSCIDTAFPMQGHLSTEYVKTVQQYTESADIVVISHPWVFPFALPVISDSKHLLVYDSHNHEGLLRVKLLDDGSEEANKVLREAVRCEYELCRAANLILACSEEDKQSYMDLYDVDASKVIVVPNGVFTSKLSPCESPEKKRKIRRRLGLKLPTVCFIGSNYHPNEEAARLIQEVSQDLPQYHFVIIGGVGNALDDVDRGKFLNLTITGFVDEDVKLAYLHASDIAINPMLSGSGTNIKMFDFMATGLPIISTDIGARGIPNTNGNIYELCNRYKGSLSECIVSLLGNDKRLKQLRDNARIEVCEKYSWEQISYVLGYKLYQQYRKVIKKESPFFSVIIPSYERHNLLGELLNMLAKQSYKDFEVIIVDQSKSKYEDWHEHDKMDIIYFKTDVKGAVKARNTAARMAKGQILAFIDDDCIPDTAWLKNAVKYFSNPEIVGIEGLIEADIYDSKTHRVVSNIGSEETGFRTANLFLRREIFNKIEGFDEQFDCPHFREDTDFGWRASIYGSFPHCSDVKVIHPSHKIDTKRESPEERNKFFVQDPLLLKKHPERYIKLFLLEHHYTNPEYWKYFIEGLERHQAYDRLPEFFSNRKVLEAILSSFALEEKRK